MFLFRRYNHFVKTRPLATNILTTGLLFGVGDIMAQTIESNSSSPDLLKDAQVSEPENPKHYDSMRTARAVFYGAVIFAPMADKWYKVLQKTEVVKGSRGINTVVRVAMDQVGFAPLVGIPLYFSVMTWMESVMAGETNVREKIRDKLASSYVDTLKSNWAVWPAVQLVNFAFVPVGMRLLVVNVVSIGWNCFLSMQMNGGGEMLIFD